MAGRRRTSNGFNNSINNRDIRVACDMWKCEERWYWVHERKHERKQRSKTSKQTSKEKEKERTRKKQKEAEERRKKSAFDPLNL